MKKIIVFSLVFVLAAIQNFAFDDVTTDKAARRAARIAEAENYGTNIIRIVPIRIADVGGVGIGVDYEKIFNNKKVGLVMPFTYFIRSDYYYNASENLSSNFFYFAPGLKFYPFGQRKITYALGPNLLFGYGMGRSLRYYSNLNKFENYSEIENYSKLQFGMMLNNYLNIQFTERFNFGVELGFGVNYINKTNYENQKDYNRGMGVNGNFAVSFGYRF